MATKKKPAKPIAGQSKEMTKVLLGKAVMYFGSKNAEPFTCPTCSRQLIKGVIYEENNSSFCSRTCIPKPQ
jgi:hypothetical protein